jgi:hypothetical protein
MSALKNHSFYNGILSHYIETHSIAREALCGIQIALEYYANGGNPGTPRASLLTRSARYLMHIILALRSIYSIITGILRGVRVAHYWIDAPRDKKRHPVDPRAHPIVEALSTDQVFTLLHINSLRFSFLNRATQRYPIYMESLAAVIAPFLTPSLYNFPASSADLQPLIATHVARLPFSYALRVVSRIFFRVTKISHLILLDDGRHTNELVLEAERLDIPSTAYMHNRFNSYHIGLRFFPFKRYLVWSEYFQNAAMALSPLYTRENVIITGFLRAPASGSTQNRVVSSTRTVTRAKILLLHESNISYSELSPYLDELSKDTTFDLVIRRKGTAVLPAELDRLIRSGRATTNETGTLSEALLREEISCVLGTHSTALFECYLAHVPSLIVKSSFDYGDHLVHDMIVPACDSPALLISATQEVINDHDGLQARTVRIWGTTPNIRLSSQQLKEVLVGNKYEPKNSSSTAPHLVTR